MCGVTYSWPFGRTFEISSDITDRFVVHFSLWDIFGTSDILNRSLTAEREPVRSDCGGGIPSGVQEQKEPLVGGLEEAFRCQRKVKTAYQGERKKNWPVFAKVIV